MAKPRLNVSVLRLVRVIAVFRKVSANGPTAFTALLSLPADWPISRAQCRISAGEWMSMHFGSAGPRNRPSLSTTIIAAKP